MFKKLKKWKILNSNYATPQRGYGMKTNNGPRKCGLQPHERRRGVNLSRLGLRKLRHLCPHGLDASVILNTNKNIWKKYNLSKKDAKNINSALLACSFSASMCFNKNWRLRNYFIYNFSVYRRSLRYVSHRRFVMPAWPDCVAVRERLQRRFFNSAAVHLATWHRRAGLLA